ncbi:hypothetical protein KHX94_00025 [Shewanella dokdonensis]|uniref:Uncharacterized protein n=1 Tax=Shewanella dokdonensis TaxID=712036 RepID=A0ABX8DHJ3_9GAMM|nr:hypothetical protein [Shewanella dokdonensis]QVK23272.1 hypothetical protein KHX94_00025 [Shewanella dokdonensis]
MTFTLLLGSAVAQGNFTLSAPYSSFDGLVVIAGGDDSSYAAMSFLPTDMLNAVRSLGLDVCCYSLMAFASGAISAATTRPLSPPRKTPRYTAFMATNTR